MMKSDKNIGARVGLARESKGITQQELTEEIERHTGKTVSRSLVTKWENNKRTIDSEDIVALCEILGVSAGYLLGIEELPRKDTRRELVAKYTGLSESAVERLHNITDKLNRIEKATHKGFDPESIQQIMNTDKLPNEEGTCAYSRVVEQILVFLDFLINSNALNEIANNATSLRTSIRSEEHVYSIDNGRKYDNIIALDRVYESICKYCEDRKPKKLEELIHAHEYMRELLFPRTQQISKNIYQVSCEVCDGKGGKE